MGVISQVDTAIEHQELFLKFWSNPSLIRNLSISRMKSTHIQAADLFKDNRNLYPSIFQAGRCKLNNLT